MEKIFTLTDIDYYLQEYLGLKWADKIIYDTLTRNYRRARIEDFNKTAYIYVKINDKKYSLMRAKVDNENFVLVDEMRTKIDDSKQWQEYMNKHIYQKPN